MDAGYEIERLLQYGRRHHMVEGLNLLLARNVLLDLFHLDTPSNRPVPDENFDTPTPILENLLDAAAEQRLYSSEAAQFRVNFEARMMGALMPGAEECARLFQQRRDAEGPEAATDWFYRLCIDSNYIRTAQIAKNVHWQTPTPYGNLEITINLTKPEKDPKTIALERQQPQSGYPACMLCPENIGYSGRVNFPARQTLRLIPLTLDGERFYLQYSPYVYFNEHCIVLNERHTPMEMTSHTLAEIFDFVEQFPHYICGSNADLPIVGGSILSHSHFQGGRCVFPMTRATVALPLRAAAFPGVEAGILHWPVSAVRLTGADRKAVCQAGCTLLESWRNWSDESVDIVAFDGETPHNTVNPILHRDANGRYVLDIVPRNNRTSAEWPDGIFHPHPQWHNIKKENIGLIEAMGLAILPSRLKAQSAAIAEILSGLAPNTSRQPGSPLAVHADWIATLIEKHGTALSHAQAAQTVRDEIGLVFCHVLEDAGVFKQTPEGQAAFVRWLASAGFKPET